MMNSHSLTDAANTTDPLPPANGGGSVRLFADARRWVQHKALPADSHSLGSLTGSPVFTGPVQRVSVISSD